jgi:Putative Ig domain
VERSWGLLTPFKLALVLVGVFAAIAVTGASGADFDNDNGPCPGTSDNKILSRCPTAFVGVKYEVQLLSEEDSGCVPYDWFEIPNGSLPPGLSMTRDGLISGVPTSAGFFRFWVWDHDFTAAEGGPDWCQFEDRSEREFSIFVDPGVAIDNETVKGATIGQTYSETLTAKHVVTLNPRTGDPVQATWSLLSGALPPGITLSESGALTGTPTSEGSYQFVVKALNGSSFDTKTYTLSVRQAVSVNSPLGSVIRPSAEVGLRFGKTFTATGGSGTYTWAVASGALPSGVALDATKGTISGVPQAAGKSAFALTATDSEGRVATEAAAMTVAPRLAIKTQSLKAANLGSAYAAKLATTGGAKPVKWRVVSGKLPLGMRFATRLGTFVGVPRQSGTFRVAVEARDALGVKTQSKLVLLVKS